MSGVTSLLSAKGGGLPSSLRLLHCERLGPNPLIHSKMKGIVCWVLKNGQSTAVLTLESGLEQHIQMVGPEMDGRRYLIPEFVLGAFCDHPEDFLPGLPLE